MPRRDIAVTLPLCSCLAKETTTSAIESPVPTIITEASSGILAGSAPGMVNLQKALSLFLASLQGMYGIRGASKMQQSAMYLFSQKTESVQNWIVRYFLPFSFDLSYFLPFCL